MSAIHAARHMIRLSFVKEALRRSLRFIAVLLNDRRGDLAKAAGAGFRGSLRVVSEWTTRRRRSERAESGLSRPPGVRTIARMMTVGRATLSKAETVTLAVIENGVPSLEAARDMVDDFQTMLRCKAKEALEPWIERARTSLIAGFANGIAKDKAAVLAAITSAWSNGQSEGQITKLKLVKRQMYGRGKIDLLEARLIGAP